MIDRFKKCVVLEGVGLDLPLIVGPMTEAMASEYADLIVRAYSGGIYPNPTATVRDVIEYTERDLDVLRGAVEAHERTKARWSTTPS